jgi:hypothetical protein
MTKANLMSEFLLEEEFEALLDLVDQNRFAVEQDYEMKSFNLKRKIYDLKFSERNDSFQVRKLIKASMLKELGNLVFDSNKKKPRS